MRSLTILIVVLAVLAFNAANAPEGPVKEAKKHVLVDVNIAVALRDKADGAGEECTAICPLPID